MIAGGTKNLSAKGRSKAFIFSAPTHTQFLYLQIQECRSALNIILAINFLSKNLR